MTKTETLAKDGKPLDYQDPDGTWWIMSACGHRTGHPWPTIKKGKGRQAVWVKATNHPQPQPSSMCPNCMLLIRFGTKITVVYMDRLPDYLRNEHQLEVE